MTPSLITLTTDFGLSDHFVGTMKGVILNINPAARFVDISHAVNSFDLFDGALTLALAYRYFPPDSIHLVIVDPGVGSVRRPIIARAGKHTFVAPDNGVLSLIYERHAPVEVRHVTSEHYFLKPVSNTFHGRDIFAPTAGWLSKGVEPEKFGDVITDFIKFTPPKPRRVTPSEIQGTVIKVDKFGNLITNIAPEDAPELFAPSDAAFRIRAGQQEIGRLVTSYAAGKEGELFAILGSSGYLELAQNRGSAAKSLQAARGAEVKIVIEQARRTP